MLHSSSVTRRVFKASCRRHNTWGKTTPPPQWHLWFSSKHENYLFPTFKRWNKTLVSIQNTFRATFFFLKGNYIMWSIHSQIIPFSLKNQVDMYPPPIGCGHFNDFLIAESQTQNMINVHFLDNHQRQRHVSISSLGIILCFHELKVVVSQYKILTELLTHLGFLLLVLKCVWIRGKTEMKRSKQLLEILMCKTSRFIYSKINYF